jgi:DNA polymerase III sliding clamp (beta) subunit (PCNA family)
MVQGDGAKVLDGQTIAQGVNSLRGGRRLGRGSKIEKESKVMSTLEKEQESAVSAVNYVEVEGESLLTLLEGVSTHASKDKSLPTLNAVEILASEGVLFATATDRYRLIEGTLHSLDGRLDVSLVSLEDIKKVITLVKSHKLHRVQLSRIGDTLTVSSLGDAITFTLLEGKYPPTEELFLKSEGEPVAVEGMAFNPAFMADYAKIAGKGEGIKVYFNGDKMPMRVRITGNKVTWRALLMPMHYRD